MIPKIIHYCWLSSDPFPAEIAGWIATWHQHLPDYELMLWNLERFPLSRSVWVKEAFEARKYAFAADYIRLHALYEYGGIYLDSDVEVRKPFGELLARPFLLGYERNGSIEGGIMGAEPHAPWVKACLDHYRDRHFIRPDGSMEMTELPKILDGCLNQFGLDRSLILPWDYLTACSPHIEPAVTENTRTVHHFYGGWLEAFRRADLLKLGSYRLVKVKKRIKRVDFSSPDYPRMFKPYEKRLASVQLSPWKMLVLLKTEETKPV